jgi:signal transduction histidine kinase
MITIRGDDDRVLGMGIDRLYPCAMPTASHPWERRLDWTLSALHWGSFTFAVVVSFLVRGAGTETTVSALFAGAYVVALQVLPRRFRNTESVGELMAVIGVVVSLFAVALTGGIESAYLLYLAAPSFFAGAFLGFRIGIETALLTSTGIIIVVATLDQEIVQGAVVQVAFLYVLMAVAFAQARRVLVEERARSAALVEASEITDARLRRLEGAHSALSSLSDLASSADLNPVSVGEAALRDLALLVPYIGGQVVLNDESGTVVVARRGQTGGAEQRAVYPMELADRRLGHVALWPLPNDDLEPRRDVIEEVVKPVTLAFDNILLLRTIARRAVQEERIRLARELHDDVGPALASLGLGVDLAIQQPETTPAAARHLESLRRSITELTENVRRTVADLRHEPVDSLVEQAHRLVGEVGADGPAVFVDIDERRTPRAAVATQISAIMAEAVRNAVEHAGAKAIRIEGTVDRDSGTLTIEDDGAGFDTSSAPPGHFGVIGMRERAAGVGAKLSIESQPHAGTKVVVAWEG